MIFAFIVGFFCVNLFCNWITKDFVEFNDYS